MKKRITSSKKLQKKLAKNEKKKDKPLVSIEELIRHGDDAMQSLDVERAHSNYSAAAALLQPQIQWNIADSNSTSSPTAMTTRKRQLVQVLSKLGDTKVSLGDPDGACDDLLAAVDLLQQEDEDNMHEIRSSIFLNLGQLNSEAEALEYYRKGIEELQQRIRQEEQGHDESTTGEDNTTATNDASSLTALRRQLVGAYCSVAELYLTDLCYDETAEQDCETAVQAAISMRFHTACNNEPQPSIDALQASANLRLSQQRNDEACQHMLAAYEQMKRGCEALSVLVGLRSNAHATLSTDTAADDGALELLDVDAADNLPGFEFRCQSVKLLLECAANSTASSTDSCVKSAIQVVGSLLAENDEVIEVWYLAGCAFAASRETEIARQYWERALEMLRQVQQNLQQVETYDEEAESHLAEVELQIEEICSKLQEAGEDETENGDIVMGEEQVR